MTLEPDRVAELTQRMLRKRLYVVMSTAKGGPEELKPHLAAHLDYMIALEKKGVVFASGPFSGADGKPGRIGMTILRAADAAEARKFAESDPFFVAGLRTFEVHEWTVMEGTVAIRVNFSDQSLELN